MLIVKTYTNKRNAKLLQLHSVEVIHNNVSKSFYNRLTTETLNEVLKQYDHSLVRHINVLSARDLEISEKVVF